MSDQGEQTPERVLADDCRFFAESVERQGTPWAHGCANVLRLAADALRSAEARGRVQGLREAAEYVKECREPRAVVQTFDVMVRQIAARADAIEQEQPK